MPTQELAVREYCRNRKADFLRDFPAEASAAADLLGIDVKSLTFDLVRVSSDPSVRIRFRTRVGSHAVWVEVTGEGHDMAVQMVMEKRSVV
jgi:hypothetical protein